MFRSWYFPLSVLLFATAINHDFELLAICNSEAPNLTSARRPIGPDSGFLWK